MTDDKLLELATRCEQATGPDRELDADIAVAALGYFIAEPRYEGAPVAYGYIDKDGSRVEPGHGGKQLIREFTASLDAAMTLVPEGWEWQLENTGSDTFGPFVAKFGQLRDVEAKTLALALCSAALRARSLANKETEK